MLMLRFIGNLDLCGQQVNKPCRTSLGFPAVLPHAESDEAIGIACFLVYSTFFKYNQQKSSCRYCRLPWKVLTWTCGFYSAQAILSLHQRYRDWCSIHVCLRDYFPFRFSLGLAADEEGEGCQKIHRSEKTSPSRSKYEQIPLWNLLQIP